MGRLLALCCFCWPRTTCRMCLARSADNSRQARYGRNSSALAGGCSGSARSEEHTSELQSLMHISYAVFCLKKKKNDVRLRFGKSTEGLERIEKGLRQQQP